MNPVDSELYESEEDCEEGRENDSHEIADKYHREHKRIRILAEVRQKKEERRNAPAKSRKYARFDSVDMQMIESMWGEFSIGTIAKRLKRTIQSIHYLARKLKLLSPKQGRHTLQDVETMTGYDRKTIMAAVRKLGIEIPRIPAGQLSVGIKQPERWRGIRYGFEEDVVEQITTYLKPFYKSVKKSKFVWGMDGAPLCCPSCKRNDRKPSRNLWWCGYCSSDAVRRYRRGTLLVGDELQVALMIVEANKSGKYAKRKSQFVCVDCHFMYEAVRTGTPSRCNRCRMDLYNRVRRKR